MGAVGAGLRLGRSCFWLGSCTVEGCRSRLGIREGYGGLELRLRQPSVRGNEHQASCNNDGCFSQFSTIRIQTMCTVQTSCRLGELLLDHRTHPESQTCTKAPVVVEPLTSRRPPIDRLADSRLAKGSGASLPAASHCPCYARARRKAAAPVPPCNATVAIN